MRIAMQRDTISVITPTHRARLAPGGLYSEAMNSVARQSLLPDAICTAIDVDGEGAAPTRQRALDMARTTWVAFLDSDDLWMPRHLELLLRFALDREVDYAYSWFKILQQMPDGRRNVLEDDPIFPPGHYLNEWDPANPIETTITTLVRTELAQAVGFKALDRGHDANSGEDFNFTLGVQAAGGKIGHLRRKTWLWRHWQLPGGVMGNTSGLPHKGDGPAAP
jgi:glycosyltransferase involved in cell wall biosynthesis